MESSNSKALQGIVRQIIPFSAVDGPGNRTVIFFQGCNMHCLTCHNPETIPVTTNIKPVTVEELVKTLLRYRQFIDGVTISGGECTLQAPFLFSLVKSLAEEGISVLIDSNGINVETLSALKPYIDGVMLDIKSADESEHLALTGVPFRDVANSAKRLLSLGLISEVRTVVHPDLCWEESLSWVAQLISGHPEIRYKVIAFRPHGVKGIWRDKSPADREFMLSVRQMLIRLDVANYIVVS